MDSQGLSNQIVTIAKELIGGRPPIEKVRSFKQLGDMRFRESRGIGADETHWWIDIHAWDALKDLKRANWRILEDIAEQEDIIRLNPQNWGLAPTKLEHFKAKMGKDYEKLQELERAVEHLRYHLDLKNLLNIGQRLFRFGLIP